jgi:hypothetical protein
LYFILHLKLLPQRRERPIHACFLLSRFGAIKCNRSPLQCIPVVLDTTRRRVTCIYLKKRPNANKSSSASCAASLRFVDVMVLLRSIAAIERISKRRHALQKGRQQGTPRCAKRIVKSKKEFFYSFIPQRTTKPIKMGQEWCWQFSADFKGVFFAPESPHGRQGKEAQVVAATARYYPPVRLSKCIPYSTRSALVQDDTRARATRLLLVDQVVGVPPSTLLEVQSRAKA